VSLELYISLTLAPVAIEMGQAPCAQEGEFGGCVGRNSERTRGTEFLTTSVWKGRCLIRRFEDTITTQHYG
jgi:hypothetical protein